MKEALSLSYVGKNSRVPNLSRSSAVLNKIKEAVVGKKYNVSLVFLDKSKARALNKKYRKKTYAPNVLSFPISKSSGEIFICPLVAKKELEKGHKLKNYIISLFIHGLCHLKGYAHGSKMDEVEQKTRDRFGIK